MAMIMVVNAFNDAFDGDGWEAVVKGWKGLFYATEPS